MQIPMAWVAGVTFVSALVAAEAAGAQAVSGVAVLHATAGSAVTIRGSTTIGARWHCRATDFEARVAIVGTDVGTPIPEVRGVTVQVPVAALRCQSAPMERAMRRALKSDQDPAARDIAGRFEIFDDRRATAPGAPVLSGGLRVAGAERNVLVRAFVTSADDGALQVRSSLPLMLSDFGIVAPRVLFGTVRARDAVMVEIELQFPARQLITARPGGEQAP